MGVVCLSRWGDWGTRPLLRTGEMLPILGINFGKIVEKCSKNEGECGFICETLRFFEAQFRTIFGLGSQ